MRNMEKLDYLNKRDTVSHWAGLLGIDFELIDSSHGRSRLSIKKEFLNPLNMIHGGLLYTVADVSASVLLDCSGHEWVTASSDFYYLKPVNGDVSYVFSEASVIKIGKTLGVTRTEVFDDKNVLVATGIFSHSRVG